MVEQKTKQILYAIGILLMISSIIMLIKEIIAKMKLDNVFASQLQYGFLDEQVQVDMEKIKYNMISASVVLAIGITILILAYVLPAARRFPSDLLAKMRERYPSQFKK